MSKCAPLPGRFFFLALNAELPFKPFQSFFLIFDVRTPDVSKESAPIRRNRGAILCTLITCTAKRTQVPHVVPSAVLVVNDVADMQAGFSGQDWHHPGRLRQPRTFDR